MIDARYRNHLRHRDHTKSERQNAVLRRSSRRVDAIGNYLRDIGRCPLLTIEQERTLSRRIKQARINYRHAMLSEIAVLRRVAEFLVQAASGEFRIDRAMEAGVCQYDEKERLKRVAAANGKTLLGMLDDSSIGNITDWSIARLARAIRLVDETKLKTSEIERICRSESGHNSTAELWLGEYEKLRNEMVRSNLRLAVSVARKFRGCGLPFLDLVQEASAGLFRAVDKFEPERGLKFSTYAVWWAKQSVYSAISEKLRLMRLPSTAIQRVRELQNRADDLQQKSERRIQLEDVAHSIGLPRQDLLHYWNARNGVASLDRPLDDNSDETFADALVARTSVDCLRKLIQAEERSTISKAMRSLDPRQRRVMHLRFGLKDGVYRNLAEVGREMSLTRERIRQIEKASLETLRRKLTE